MEETISRRNFIGTLAGIFIGFSLVDANAINPKKTDFEKGELIYREEQIEIREHSNRGNEVWVRNKRYLLNEGDLKFFGGNRNLTEIELRLRKDYPKLFSAINQAHIEPSRLRLILAKEKEKNI